jgi:hypothetical protein
MAWAKWKSLHPDSYVLKEDSKHTVNYDFRRLPEVTDMPGRSAVSRSPLPPGTLVFGIMGRSPKAFSRTALELPRGVADEIVDGKPVAVFSDPSARAYAAYYPEVDGQAVKFAGQSRNGVRVFLDSATGSVWTIEGVCVEGKLKGKALATAPSALCRLRTWQIAFPNSEVSRPRRTASPTPFFAAR